MNQTTQAQQDRLDRASRRFQEVNAELQGMLNTLLREVQGLRDTWQGQGGRSFEVVKQAWIQHQVKLNRNLLETAEALRTAGQNYTISDADAAGRMRGTARYGGTELPL